MSQVVPLTVQHSIKNISQNIKAVFLAPEMQSRSQSPSPRFWDFRLHGACVAWYIWHLEIKSMWIRSTRAFNTHWKDQGSQNLALKAHQYQILKAKATKALGTSLLIIPELRVLVLTKRHVGSGNEIARNVHHNRNKMTPAVLLPSQQLYHLSYYN